MLIHSPSPADAPALREVDYLVAGQGLAGTIMALTLLGAGKRVLVVADGEPAHASRAAMGVVNPITGMRFTPSYRFDEAMGPTFEFYRAWEARWDTRLWHPAPIHRLFTGHRELRRWSERRRQLEAAGEWEAQAGGSWNLPEDHPWVPYLTAERQGGIRLERGGWLDIHRLLDRAHAELKKRGSLLSAKFDPREVRTDGDGTSWNGVRAAGGIILCEGYAGLAGDPLLEALPRRSAKGEVLLIRADLPSDGRLGIAQHGVFVVPAGEPGLWRVGANYEWEDLSNRPTEAGREYLETTLRQFFRFDWEVVNHFAGVRPILTDKLPVLGRLPGRPGFAVLNGLASKGTLLGPWSAALLLQHLESGEDIPPDLDVRRNFPL